VRRGPTAATPVRAAARALLAAALLCRAAFAATAEAGAPAISGLAARATIAELTLLERLNRSVRFDAEVAIKAEWGDSYGRIDVVELPDVENRYALFEDDARRRVDVAIRGTVNLKNALFDIEFLKSRSASLGISLHGGFERVAAALYADLRPRIRDGYSIRIAGHSLGAAEAIIAGMFLARDGCRVELVLASAPPKVTDAEGWSRFPLLPVVRLVGPYDPVPFLPPKDLLYGRDPYVQGGPALLLLDGAKYTILDSSFFDSMPDEARKAFGEGRHFAAADHLIGAYLARLESKAGGAEYVGPEGWERYATAAPGGR